MRVLSKSTLTKPLILLILIAPVASAVTLIAYWVYISNWQGEEWWFAPLEVNATYNATALNVGEVLNITITARYPLPWEYLNITPSNYTISGPYYDPVNDYWYYNGTFYPNSTAAANGWWYNFTVPKNMTFKVIVAVYYVQTGANMLYWYGTINNSIEFNETKVLGSFAVRLSMAGNYVVKVFVWTDYPSTATTLWAPLVVTPPKQLIVVTG